MHHKSDASLCVYRLVSSTQIEDYDGSPYALELADENDVPTSTWAPIDEETASAYGARFGWSRVAAVVDAGKLPSAEVRAMVSLALGSAAGAVSQELLDELTDEVLDVLRRAYGEGAGQ